MNQNKEKDIDIPPRIHKLKIIFGPVSFFHWMHDGVLDRVKPNKVRLKHFAVDADCITLPAFPLLL